MQVTIDLDDELLARARQLTGVNGPFTLIHDGLRALVAQEAARRLARLGGTQPDLKAPPRRRSEPA